MVAYVTLFDVGTGTETLIIDQFARTDQMITWESKEQYFAARLTEPRPIDGGIYAYGIGAATSMAPDSIISNHIVSCLASQCLLAKLDALHAAVLGLRGADWPEWPE